MDVIKDRNCVKYGIENIETKGETAGYQQFLLLSQCFPKPFLPGTSKPVFGPAVCIVVLVFIVLLSAAFRQNESRHEVNSGLTSHYLATLWRPATIFALCNYLGRGRMSRVFGPAVCIVVLVFVVLLSTAVRQNESRHEVNSGLTSHYLVSLWRAATDNDVRIYNITWYEIPFDISYWDDAVHSGFDACQYSNCRMWFGADHVNYSDAVIIDGRLVKPEYFFKRRPGQIWIFSAHEAPVSFNDTGAHWTRGGWVSGYNWTMTYDRSNTDIYLPYGEFRKKTDKPEKDYSRIFKMKNKTALIVHSHCPSRSRRETFVNKLAKYMDVDSYGFCGKPWNCGGRFRHELDNCFDRINGYKYYLAFENAFCNQYFTEKLFRNFNYDSIMVIRGGRNNDAKRLFPNGTFISTDDFKSIKELADYLTKLAASEERYTEMLKQKDEYYSVPYKTVYQRAMCEICERLNNQDKYRKHINSTIQWAFGKEQCEKPADLNET